MKKFLKKINFKYLQKQKTDLLEIFVKLEREGLHKKADSLTGIVSLLDEIQDIAVDEYGFKEEEVFLFDGE